MDSSILLTQLIELFLMIALGFVLFRIGLMTVEFNQRLTKLVLSVTLPATLLSSVLGQTERLDSAQLATVFAVGVGLYFVFPIVAVVLVKLMRLPVENHGLYMYMMVYGNVGFMGLPVMDALYGSAGVFYTGIINIFFNLSSFTIGLLLITHGSGSAVRIRPRQMLTPGIIGSVFALLIYLLDIHFPPLLTDTIASIGSLTSPLAMLMIGGALGRIPLRSLLGGWHMYWFTLVKQFLLPLAAFPILRLLIADPFIFGITFLLFLMPVANATVLFATNYGGDETLAAKVVFLTTLVSIVSIPLLSTFCL